MRVRGVMGNGKFVGGMGSGMRVRLGEWGEK